MATPKHSASVVRCAAIKKEANMPEKMQLAEISRREAMAATVMGTALSCLPNGMAIANNLPPGPTPANLCDADCEKELENVSRMALGFRFRVPIESFVVEEVIKMLHLCKCPCYSIVKRNSTLVLMC